MAIHALNFFTNFTVHYFTHNTYTPHTHSLSFTSSSSPLLVYFRRINVRCFVVAYIPPQIMVPKNRLRHLIKNAAELQNKRCIYHNAHNNHVYLFEDHHCDRYVDSYLRFASHLFLLSFSLCSSHIHTKYTYTKHTKHNSNISVMSCRVKLVKCYINIRMKCGSSNSLPLGNILPLRARMQHVSFGNSTIQMYSFSLSPLSLSLPFSHTHLSSPHSLSYSFLLLLTSLVGSQSVSNHYRTWKAVGICGVES